MDANIEKVPNIQDPVALMLRDPGISGEWVFGTIGIASCSSRVAADSGYLQWAVTLPTQSDSIRI